MVIFFFNFMVLIIVDDSRKDKQTSFKRTSKNRTCQGKTFLMRFLGHLRGLDTGLTALGLFLSSRTRGWAWLDRP